MPSLSVQQIRSVWYLWRLGGNGGFYGNGQDSLIDDWWPLYDCAGHVRIRSQFAHPFVVVHSNYTSLLGWAELKLRAWVLQLTLFA
jgi:hypothetical protein